MDAHRIDLGLIHVVSDGNRDLVFLAHNNLKVFSIYCAPGKSSRLRINKKFYEYDHRQWDAVFVKYLEWKRTQLPHFKLPNHVGRRLDGRRHPWRRIVHPEAVQPKTETNPPPPPET